MQESIDAHQIAFLCEFFVYKVLINLFSSWLHSEDLNQSLEKKKNSDFYTTYSGKVFESIFGSKGF